MVVFHHFLLQQMAGLVADYMESEGTRFLKTCVPVSIDKNRGGQLVVKYEDLSNRQIQEEIFDTVMFATGLCITDHFPRLQHF